MTPASVRAGLVGALCALGVLWPGGAGAVDRRLGADVARPAADGAGWSVAAKARLAVDLDALLSGAPTLRGAHVGFLALDTRSGDVVYARAADDAFMPASTMKLLTGSVALALLGRSYHFHSEAYLAPSNAYGEPARQTLFLRAGGDPLLSSDDVRAMGRAAFTTGTFAFPYPFLVDAGFFELRPYPPGWSWDDFAYDYAPKLTPAPVDENAIALSVSPGPSPGAPLDVHPQAPGGDLFRHDLCSAGDVMPLAPRAFTGKPGSPIALDVVRNPPRDCIAVIGSLPPGAPVQTLDAAVPEPTEHLYLLAGSALPIPQRSGASGNPPVAAMPTDVSSVSFPVPPGARLVWTHDGEALADLLADMWWPSDNLVAEMLLRAIGLQQAGAPGTTDHGADAERGWLARIGIDPASLTIADGSGLSTYDRLTPRALTAILQTDWNGPNRDLVLDDLPLAGVRGTLERSFAGTLAERRTFAKTGSVNHTRALAGYLATLHHGALTFAWAVDDWMGTDDDLATLRARVLSRLIGD